MSDDDLKSELQTVDGVGEATAEDLLDVLDGYGVGESSLLERAREAAAEGDDREAAVFLRRSMNQ